MNDEQKKDDRLLARAGSDPMAFAAVYQRHYDAVFRYCVHRLFNRTAAEDVTSTVFLKVLENFDGFRGDATSFRSWLFRIATNSVTTHLRKTTRRFRLLRRASADLAAGSVRQPDGAETSETLARVQAAVFALRPREQAIVALRFFEGMKPKEIAEILDSSPGAVRSQLSRALAKLRKRLDRAEAPASGEVPEHV